MLLDGIARQQNEHHLENNPVSYKVERKVRWAVKEWKASGVKNVFCACEVGINTKLFWASICTSMVVVQEDTVLHYINAVLYAAHLFCEIGIMAGAELYL